MEKIVLLFDIDGTLIHTDGGGKVALKKAINRAFGHEDPFVDIDYGGRTDRSIARELLDIHKIEINRKNVQLLFDEYTHLLKEALGNSKGYLLPGIESLLPRLSRRDDIALGLVTGNVERGAYLKLSHFGIDGFFSFGGFGDHFEERSRIAYSGVKAAENYLGKPIDSSRFLIIGDTPHDVSCAKAVGVKSLAVFTGFAFRESIKDSGPDYLLEDLSNYDQFNEIVNGLI